MWECEGYTTRPATATASAGGQVGGAGARGGVPGPCIDMEDGQGGTVGSRGPDTPLNNSGGGGQPEETHG